MREAPTLVGQELLRLKGVQAGQFEAFALAVRSVAELGTFDPERKLDAKQTAALDGLAKEKGVPSALTKLLTTARPQLVTAGDVATFYGVLRGALEFIGQVTAMAELEAKPVTLPSPRAGSRAAAALRHGGAR